MSGNSPTLPSTWKHLFCTKDPSSWFVLSHSGFWKPEVKDICTEWGKSCSCEKSREGTTHIEHCCVHPVSLLSGCWDTGLHNLRLVLASKFYHILSSKRLCWAFCDICDKNDVNQEDWGEDWGLRTEDSLTPTEDTLDDLLVLINSFGPCQPLASLPQVAQPCWDRWSSQKS